jgi:hypothetical protein
MGQKWPVNFACGSDLHVNRRGLFTCRKSSTCVRRLSFPSEGRNAMDFFSRKIRRLLPGSNPRSWVSEASTLTTRPLTYLIYRPTHHYVPGCSNYRPRIENLEAVFPASRKRYVKKTKDKNGLPNRIVQKGVPSESITSQETKQ